MAAVGILTAGYGSKLALGGKAGALIDIFRTGTKGAEAVAEAARVVGKAEEIAVAAEKAGVKSKFVIDELAEVVKDGMPCKVASISPIRTLLWIIEDVAYAVDFIPGAAEDAHKEAIKDTANVSNVRWGMWSDLPKTTSGGKEYAHMVIVFTASTQLIEWLLRASAWLPVGTLVEAFLQRSWNMRFKKATW
jgi:hypothetical protein